MNILSLLQPHLQMGASGNYQQLAASPQKAAKPNNVEPIPVVNTNPQPQKPYNQQQPQFGVRYMGIGSMLENPIVNMQPRIPFRPSTVEYQYQGKNNTGSLFALPYSGQKITPLARMSKVYGR